MASMSPASSSKQPDIRVKKLKEEEEEDTWSSTLAKLKSAPTERPPATIDRQCPLSTAHGARVRAGLRCPLCSHWDISASSPSSNALRFQPKPCHSLQVYEDYDCTLNQTNISANNNKFFIIQLLECNGTYSVWSRWGRVGEVGQSTPELFLHLEDAKKEFEKKFRGKTKNSWATRENFIAQPGKYTLIEVEREVGLTSAGGGGCPQDVKMPLGKLSKQQLVRGFEALEELEAALKEQPPQATRLEELSSRFYTIVPHNFGRARPPTINSPDLLRAEKDMLLVLADIELAQSLQTQKMKEEEEEEKEVAHPLDQDKSLVYNQLSLMDLAD